jgi:hypothetical protein
MEAKSRKSTKAGRPVVVTTENRGVFFGYVKDESKAPAQITLTQVRNCVYWPMQTKGFLGLTVSGPLSGSKIGPAAPAVTLYRLTSICDCTPEAAKAWEAGNWG